MLTEKKLGYLLIVGAMLIWGSIGVIVRVIPYPSELIVFYRVIFAFLILAILVDKKRLRVKLEKVNKLLLSLTGITLVLNWVFFFQAIKITTIASATIAYYTAPIMAALLSTLFLQEKLTKQGLTALGLSFMGLGIMFFDLQNLAGAQLLGVGFALLAAFFYAVFIVSSKAVTGLKAQTLTLLQMAIAVFLLLPFAIQYQLPEGKYLILMLLLGAVHTALALVLYIKGLQLSQVQEVGVLSYLDPVSAILFAVIFLAEIPTIGTIMGGVLILGASYLAVSND